MQDIDQQYELHAKELAKKIDLRNQVDEVHRDEQNRKLREIQTDAVGQALINVGAGINTPEAFRQGYEVAREITMGIHSDNRAASSFTPLPSKPELIGIGSGEDRLSSLLSLGLREVERWNCTFAQKQALRSNLLHIVAEALLDDHADEKILKQYANKLSELGKGFQPPMTSNQRLFLDRFLDVDELIDKLR
jgi:hypothetical protein